MYVSLRLTVKPIKIRKKLPIKFHNRVAFCITVRHSVRDTFCPGIIIGYSFPLLHLDNLVMSDGRRLICRKLIIVFLMSMGDRMHGGRFLPSVVLCISYEHPSDGIHRIVLSCFMNLHPSVVCRLFGEAKKLSGVDLSNVVAHLSAAYCFIRMKHGIARLSWTTGIHQQQ